MGAHVKSILMCTHNIGFYEYLTKIIFQLSSNTHLISSSVEDPSQNKGLLNRQTGKVKDECTFPCKTLQPLWCSDKFKATGLSNQGLLV